MATEAAAQLSLPETTRIEKDVSLNKDLHVLAVDDSLVDRKIIQRLLTISSCKVTVVDSGTKALELLALQEGSDSSSFGLKVDLIMTDYCMPGMTGYELLKKIKESTAFGQVPVIIMSSDNIVAQIERCMEEGAEDYIMKPVKLADVKRIRNSMENKVAARIRGETRNKRKEMEAPLMEEVVPLLVMAAQASALPSSSPKFLCAAPALPLDSPIRRPKLNVFE